MKPQRLQLARPIISFDLETTGLDIANDKVVEICCVKIHVSGEREVRTTRLNPGRPIAAQATAVHGITDADVANAPRFEAAARELHAFFADCDLTGFNIEHFDLPLLANEFGRCGLSFPAADARVIDSFRIFCMREPRDLSAALRFYCNRELTEAHHAEADALAAADVLLAQVDRYNDLPDDVPSLHAVCRPPEWLDGQGKVVWAEDDAVISFGKHKGKSLRMLVDNDPGYLHWVCGGKFAPDVVEIMRRALNGVFPQKPAALVAAQSAKAGAAAETTSVKAVTSVQSVESVRSVTAVQSAESVRSVTAAQSAASVQSAAPASSADAPKPAAAEKSVLPAASAKSVRSVTETATVSVTTVTEKRITERRPAAASADAPQLGLFGTVR